MTQTERFLAGAARKRRPSKPAHLNPAGVRALDPRSPAVVKGRTLFPTTVVDPADSPRTLVSGEWNKKLGKRVTKGAWKGSPIFALTLEERATCPRSCHNWATCFGNNMNWARRHKHGASLTAALTHELAALQAKHPNGFVVRLHVLGDFYSVAYVKFWAAALLKYPALRVFGYTARQPSMPIGDAVAALAMKAWDRFAVRLSSSESGPRHAVTINYIAEGRVAAGLVCPAQTDKAGERTCGTCALCWSPAAKNDTILFMLHGQQAARPRLVAPLKRAA